MDKIKVLQLMSYPIDKLSIMLMKIIHIMDIIFMDILNLVKKRI